MSSIDRSLRVRQRMTWDRSLAIGLPSIDRQHAQLLVVANRLLDHPAASIRDEAVVDVLTELGRVLIQHFRAEEVTMRELGVALDEFTAHAAAHSRIIDQYTELNLAATNGRHLSATDVFDLVREWVSDHLEDYDMRLKAYLPASGAAA